MKKRYNQIYLFPVLILLIAFSCKKDVTFDLKENADDTFYLSENGANMPVKVQGNTLSKVFLVVIHGGPGGESLVTYNGGITSEIKKRFGVVYWDQRSAGNTQGSKGSNLTVDVYVNDLEKLIMLLKNKYGGDIQLFLYGHSWGGMLTSSYLIKGDNQKNISGWIEIDGVHNFPLNDVLTRDMIDSIGSIEIAAGRNVEDWTKMVTFCKALSLPTDLVNSSKLNKYAFKAEVLMGDSIAGESGIYIGDRDMTNLSSILAHDNFMGVGNLSFYNELMTKSNSSQLYKIEVPTLLCWGRYDFVVPKGMMYDAMNKMPFAPIYWVVYPNSGHSPMYNQTTNFNDNVIKFINMVK